MNIVLRSVCNVLVQPTGHMVSLKQTFGIWNSVLSVVKEPCKCIAQKNTKSLCLRQPSPVHVTLTAQHTAWSKNYDEANKNGQRKKYGQEPKSVHYKDKARIEEGPNKYQLRDVYKADVPRGYGYEQKLYMGGVLPRLDDPVDTLPAWKDRKKWDRKHALFGQNDYIDILGDGTVHPVDLIHGPDYLIGWRGNELQRLIRIRKFKGLKLQQLYPTKYKLLMKRIKYLDRKHNIKRSKRV